MKDEFWLSRIKEGATLSPVDRTAEVLFGLIMVLSFTGAISVATGGRQEIHDLLWAALGCNVAWGLVDAIMYLMNIIIARAHDSRIIRMLDESREVESTRKIMKDELPPLLTALLSETELDQVASRLRQISAPSRSIWITGKDLWAGVEIFLLVFLCTVPVAIPFAILREVHLALRVSNGVALVLLFATGFRLAAYAGLRRGLTALVYTLIGLALVSLTMALGG